MFNIGGGEILGLLILGMILIGPDRMPNIATDAARLHAEMLPKKRGLKSPCKGPLRLRANRTATIRRQWTPAGRSSEARAFG